MDYPPDLMISFRARGYIRASLIECINIEDCQVTIYLRDASSRTYLDIFTTPEEAKAFAKEIADAINASLSGGTR